MNFYRFKQARYLAVFVLLSFMMSFSVALVVPEATADSQGEGPDATSPTFYMDDSVDPNGLVDQVNTALDAVDEPIPVDWTWEMECDPSVDNPILVITWSEDSDYPTRTPANSVQRGSMVNVWTFTVQHTGTPVTATIEYDITPTGDPAPSAAIPPPSDEELDKEIPTDDSTDLAQGEIIDDGTGDGSDDGSGDGFDEGTGDGSDEGTGDGSDDGSDDGTGDGSVDGTGDGSDDGTGDGIGDGSDDGIGDGSDDGTGDGSDDGIGDGSDDGTGDGIGDGSDDGTGDGSDDGSGDSSGSTGEQLGGGGGPDPGNIVIKLELKDVDSTMLDALSKDTEIPMPIKSTEVVDTKISPDANPTFTPKSV